MVVLGHQDLEWFIMQQQITDTLELTWKQLKKICQKYFDKTGEL